MSKNVLALSQLVPDLAKGTTVPPNKTTSHLKSREQQEFHSGSELEDTDHDRQDVQDNPDAVEVTDKPNDSPLKAELTGDIQVSALGQLVTSLLPKVRLIPG